MGLSRGKVFLLIVAAASAALLAGCPLPFEYNGKDGGNAHSSDPSTPNMTAPVLVSYSVQSGTSGTIADGGSVVAGNTTTVTLATASLNSVIFYTDDGTTLTDLRTARKISASSGSFTISRTTTPQSLDIHAVAVGSNMLPSPQVHAMVSVSPYPILSITSSSASISENGGTATFTITSSLAPSGNVPVTLQASAGYTTADEAGLPGPGPVSQTLLSGITTISIPITGVHNPLNASHTVTLTIQDDPNTPPAYTVGTPSSASVVILDDSAHTVTYNGNGSTGGTVPTDSGSYVPGALVTVANVGTMSWPGHLFMGWNTANDGSGTPHGAGTIMTMGTTDVVLYAMWLPTYTVTYNGNGSTGGTVPTDNTAYLQGATVTVANPGTMTRTAYTFAHWNTAANGLGTSFNAGAPLTMGSANVVLYAIWTPIQYTVTYVGNGNDGGTAPVDGGTYTTGQSAAVLGQGSLTLSTGFFAGWNTAANGSGTTYTAGQTVTIVASNVTLYAMWIGDSGGVITSVPLSATNVVIPEGVTDFGTAFRSHPNLVSVTLPSTITGIQVQAFLGCNSLTTVVSNNVRYQVINGALVDTQTWTLMLVPAKLSGAFTIPNGVVSIDPYAFGNCTNLTTINIPSSLVVLSGNAFSGLQSAISIPVPISVGTFADYAFFNSSVTNLIMQSSTPPLLGGANVFTSSSPVIHVPTPSAVLLYQADPSWAATGLTIVTP